VIFLVSSPRRTYIESSDIGTTNTLPAELRTSDHPNAKWVRYKVYSDVESQAVYNSVHPFRQALIFSALVLMSKFNFLLTRVIKWKSKPLLLLLYLATVIKRNLNQYDDDDDDDDILQE
jgi:hypothetical protein